MRDALAWVPDDNEGERTVEEKLRDRCLPFESWQHLSGKEDFHESPKWKVGGGLRQQGEWITPRGMVDM